MRKIVSNVMADEMIGILKRGFKLIQCFIQMTLARKDRGTRLVPDCRKSENLGCLGIKPQDQSRCIA